MNIYVVIEHGVYRHNVWVRETAETAKALASRLANESDGYHSYEVFETNTIDGCLDEYDDVPIAEYYIGN